MDETAVVPIEQFPEISPGWGWMLLIYYLIEGERHRTIADTTKKHAVATVKK